jgi:hypothetical protein
MTRLERSGGQGVDLKLQFPDVCHQPNAQITQLLADVLGNTPLMRILYNLSGGVTSGIRFAIGRLARVLDFDV